MDAEAPQAGSSGPHIDGGGTRFVDRIRGWASELGFSAVGISGLALGESGAQFRSWLAQGRHGSMDYLERNAGLREQPARLMRGAVRMISVRMDYLPREAGPGWARHELARVGAPGEAVVAVYARGRDYHRAVRGRLARLADRILEAVPGSHCRALCDSAPVFEVEFARKAGIGWRGKHTLLLSREAGSMFFLGEILTDLDLPVDAPASDHCGNCVKCIDVCPTRAILAPFELDARRCISYLTIEHEGPIPEPLRPLIANRIYGCDDCQLVCPWNRYAQPATHPDFDPRNGLAGARLAELAAWTGQEFHDRLIGSPIRRIGFDRWSRNLAVALGNEPPGETATRALRERLSRPASEMVREHLLWALYRQSGATL
jgi:epoxyqueuosine reductase